MPRTSLPTRTARAMSLARKTKSGNPNGGTRSKTKKRCPCGVTTLKRAIARGKEATHKAGCAFAR